MISPDRCYRPREVVEETHCPGLWSMRPSMTDHSELSDVAAPGSSPAQLSWRGWKDSPSDGVLRCCGSARHRSPGCATGYRLGGPPPTLERMEAAVNSRQPASNELDGQASLLDSYRSEMGVAAA